MLIWFLIYISSILNLYKLPIIKFFMNKTKTCLSCGNAFNPTGRNALRQKYCDFKCRIRYMNKQDKRTYQDRKRYLQKYNREYYYKNPERKNRVINVYNKNPRYLEKKKLWIIRNKDKIKKADERFRKSEKRKLYLANYKKTEKFKKMQRESDEKYRKKYPNRIVEIRKKYYRSDKGILNNMKKSDNRRKKSKEKSGVLYERPKKDLLIKVKKRDKNCIYCGKDLKLIDKMANKHICNEHINPILPFSEYNFGLNCSDCNSSKGEVVDKPFIKLVKKTGGITLQLIDTLKERIIEWCKYKGFVPNPLVFKMLKQQRQTINFN